jgi:protease I
MVTMTERLTGKRIAFLFTTGVEQVELTTPRKALEDAGATVDMVSIQSGPVLMFDGVEHGDTVNAELSVDSVDAAEYDALVLPGGVVNADKLRTDRKSVEFVRTFADRGSPIGAICHAPWVLIEAGVVADRPMTSWPSLRTDLQNAGARWRDESVVVDRGLVTSRGPKDLDAFCAKLIEEAAEGKHEPATSGPPLS